MERHSMLESIRALDPSPQAVAITTEGLVAAVSRPLARPGSRRARQPSSASQLGDCRQVWTVHQGCSGSSGHCWDGLALGGLAGSSHATPPMHRNPLLRGNVAAMHKHRCGRVCVTGAIHTV